VVDLEQLLTFSPGAHNFVSYWISSVAVERNLVRFWSGEVSCTLGFNHQGVYISGLDLQGSSWVLELQQVSVLLSSFVPLIVLWDPCAFISISHNAVVVSCNMDNSIWIKNATQHNPGMKFGKRNTLCNSVFILCCCQGLGGVSLFAFVWYPPKGIIIYLKMRLVFLYTLLGLPAAALPVSINHSIDEKNELIL